MVRVILVWADQIFIIKFGLVGPNLLEEMVQIQEFWSGLLIFQIVAPSSDRHDNHSLNTHIYADSYNIIQLND